MKRIIFVMILLATAPVIGGAQRNIAYSATDQTNTPAINKKASRSLMAQLRAEKDFLQSHKTVEDIRWYDDDRGYFVYYSRQGNRGRCFYDKKGKFVYDAISYPEQFLSSNLRDWVKSVYYNDYKIATVNEIHVKDQVVYFIHLTDGKTWKKLKIQNDEMELVSDFKAG